VTAEAHAARFKRVLAALRRVPGDETGKWKLAAHFENDPTPLVADYREK
jgi:hypothetical protein